MYLYDVAKTYYNKKKHNKKLLKTIKESNSFDEISSVLTQYSMFYNINCRDMQYNTPFIIACQRGNQDLIELVLQYGADPSLYNCKGYNGFLMAVKHGHLSIVKYLINPKLNTDINKLDSRGNNAYIIASKYGHIHIMNYFDIDKIINRNHQNYYGDDAFTIHRSPDYFLSKLIYLEKSVKYLAMTGFETHFNGIKYLADFYYQTFYRLKPPLLKVSKEDRPKCVLCQLPIKKYVARCRNNHYSHTDCLLASIAKDHWYFKENKPCYICGDMNLMDSKNIYQVKLLQIDENEGL